MAGSITNSEASQGALIYQPGAELNIYLFKFYKSRI